MRFPAGTDARLCQTWDGLQASPMNRFASWIKPELNSAVSEATFACRIEADSKDLVELVAKGFLSAEALGFDDRKVAKVRRELDGCGGVKVASHEWLAAAGHNCESGAESFYLHSIFRIDEEELLVLVGITPPADELRRERVLLQQQAAGRIKRYEEEMERYREELESEEARRKREMSEIENRADLSERDKVLWRKILDYEPFPGQGSNERQSPDCPRLSDLHFEPERVVLVYPLPKSTKARTKAILTALAASGRAPSRNGVYDCSKVPRENGRDQICFVRWKERDIMTPALEIKAALELRLKSAFKKPRSSSHFPPDLPSVDDEETITRGDSGDPPALPWDDLPQPTPEGKEAFERRGFEAIAWYQPFHCYDDSAWGIHFHASRLDAFASCLAQDPKLKKEPRRHELAVHLALRLTAAHEFFHARVDFAAGWLELGSKRPRYLQYWDKVYRPASSTSDWLEEALANWNAHCWLLSNLEHLRGKGLIQDPSLVGGVVKDWLDFSPPGYKDWRQGQTHQAWDRLASELASGTPFPSGGSVLGLPLGGVIQENGPFDLGLEDVPVYFVGKGLIADACFGAPCRREVHRVLRHFTYHLEADRGKGSHELWKGPDGRAFPLPARDPLSVGVFHSLLDHFGWSKQHYMQQIRTLV